MEANCWPLLLLGVLFGQIPWLLYLLRISK